MRRSTILGAATAAALAAGSLAVGLAPGSSHREAPKILADPTADNTDVYAFTAPDAPGSLTVVANWIPLEEPAGGPVLRQARSRGAATTSRSTTPATGGRTSPTAGSSTSASATRSRSWTRPRPSTRSTIRTSTSSRPTTSTARRTTARRSGRAGSRTTCRSPRQRRPEDLSRLRQGRRAGHQRRRGRRETFVGPADDPFFVDLGAVFDGINIDKPGRPNIGLGNQGGGKDDVAGYNTHAFVLQVPEAQVTRDGKAVAGADAKNAVVGVWATTERRRITVRRHHRAKARWVQVSRLGNPLINEVVIPIGQKDRFNRTSPRTTRRTSGSTR